MLCEKIGARWNFPFNWARQKISIAALSIFTGPITFYYGDEIGFQTNQ